MEADSEEVKEPTDFSSSNGKKAKEEEDEGFHFVHFADVESIIGEDFDNGGSETPLIQYDGVSLFRNKAIVPLAIRWGLPILFLGDMALLLYSNCGIGGTVHVRVYDGGQGQTIEGPVLYKVTLKNSIVDMWNAQAYIMSCLIAVFSGAWPHLKIVVSLLCWFANEQWLGRRTRKVLLTCTYILQKLSHIETFVLVIMMVAFSLNTRLPNYPDWGVKTYVVPQAGFYTFLSGLILSMFLSRIALHYNNLADAAAAAAVERESEEASPRSFPGEGSPSWGQWRKSFFHDDDDDGSITSSGSSNTATNTTRPCRGSSKSRLSYLCSNLGIPSGNTWQDILVTYSFIALLIFFIIGLCTPSFLFHFEGLAGWVLDYVTADSSSVRSSSVLTLGLDVPGASDAPNSIGIRYLQVAYLFFVVVAPLGCLAILLSLMLLPVRFGGRILMVGEVLYAWSAPDVLFLSMVASTLEMGLFVRFVIGDKCDGVNVILKEFMDKELNGDDKCFDVKASFKTGIWVFGTSSLIFFAVAFIIMRNVSREYNQYLLDHDDDDGLVPGDIQRESSILFLSPSSSYVALHHTPTLVPSRQKGEVEEEEQEGWLADSPLLSIRGGQQRRTPRRRPEDWEALIQGERGRRN